MPIAELDVLVHGNPCLSFSPASVLDSFSGGRSVKTALLKGVPMEVDRINQVGVKITLRTAKGE